MNHTTRRQPHLSLDSLHHRRAPLNANIEFSTRSMPRNRHPNSSPNTAVMPLKRPEIKRRRSRIPVLKDSWKTFSRKVVPFLAVPPEIHLKIFEFLHPVDVVCLSIVKWVSACHLIIRHYLIFLFIWLVTDWETVNTSTALLRNSTILSVSALQVCPSFCSPNHSNSSTT